MQLINNPEQKRRKELLYCFEFDVLTGTITSFHLKSRENQYYYLKVDKTGQSD